MFDFVEQSISQSGLMPTQEEFARARAEFENGGMKPCSVPYIYEIQIKCIALGYACKRTSLPMETIDTEVLKTLCVEEQKAVSAKLMGSHHILSGVAMDSQETINTQAILFFKNHFPKTKKRCALLTGGTGSGKTYACIAYIGSVSTPDSCLFTTTYNFFDQLSRKNYPFLDRCEAVRYLLVDDLGAEPVGFKGSDFYTAFEHVFSERHTRDVTTLITSNLSADGLKTVLSERFFSRFNEIGIMCRTSDKDFRKQEEENDDKRIRKDTGCA